MADGEAVRSRRRPAAEAVSVRQLARTLGVAPAQEVLSWAWEALWGLPWHFVPAPTFATPTSPR